MSHEYIRISCGCKLFAFVLGSGLDAVSVLDERDHFCCGGTHKLVLGKYINGEISWASDFLLHAFQDIHVFVLGFGEIMVRTSGTSYYLPWKICLSLPLFLSSCPKSFQACGLLWRGAVASGDYPLAYPPVCYWCVGMHVLAWTATCNRYWERHRLWRA